MESDKKTADLLQPMISDSMCKEIFVSLKDFTKHLDENVGSALNALEDFEKKFASKLTEKAETEEQLRETVQAAYVYIDTVDDFFYYGHCTQFETIKTDIKNGNNKKLEQFIRKMDKQLVYIGNAYQEYTNSCNKVHRKCMLCVESCASLAAKAKKERREKLLIGGISAASLGTYSTFMVMIINPALGVAYGATMAAMLGVGAVGLKIAYEDITRVEAAFKAVASMFKEMLKDVIKLKHIFDEIQITVQKYERNHALISSLDRSDKDNLCLALDKIESILQSKHPETTKYKTSVKKLQSRIK